MAFPVTPLELCVASVRKYLHQELGIAGVSLVSLPRVEIENSENIHINNDDLVY